MNVETSPIQGERKFYIKVCLVVYFVWLILFEIVGWHAAQMPTHDITSFVDKKIPLIPQFIWPYLLCYVFPFLPLLVVKDWHRLNRALLSIVFANLSAFIMYLIFPVAFPRPELGRSLSDSLLSFLYQVDFRPGANKLPSLHVTFTWIVFLTCRGQRWGKLGDAIILFIAILITCSALFVKQHLIADVVIGLCWASVAWSLAGNFYKFVVDQDIDPRAGLKQMLRRILPLVVTFTLIIFSIILF
jgi:membrane-associated phospholipid phosphatase